MNAALGRVLILGSLLTATSGAFVAFAGARKWAQRLAQVSAEVVAPAPT